MVPLTLVLITGLTLHELVSREQQYIPVKTSLKQIATLQNLYHMSHRFYTTSLDTLGFFPAHEGGSPTYPPSYFALDGYIYSVLVATDASFIVQAVSQKENSPDVWQIDGTGTIRRVLQE